MAIRGQLGSSRQIIMFRPKNTGFSDISETLSTLMSLMYIPVIGW